MRPQAEAAINALRLRLKVAGFSHTSERQKGNRKRLA